MVEKLKKIFEKHREIILYVFFGGLTTAINIVSYYICYNKIGFSNVQSNIIAWVLSVIFAFITNKIWVFNRKSFSVEDLIKEFGLFISVRLLTGVLDTSIMYVGVDLLHQDGLVMKILSNILVLVTNYLGSKFIIFKENDKAN